MGTMFGIIFIGLIVLAPVALIFNIIVSSVEIRREKEHMREHYERLAEIHKAGHHLTEQEKEALVARREERP